MNIGTHPRFSLPFAAVKVVPEESTAEKVDPLCNVPRFRRDFMTGQTVRLSHEERVALAAEYAAKREIKARKRAKVAAFNALPPEAQAKVVAKKASATEKRKATKAAKDAAKPQRAPHTFVPVIREQARFIPPPALDKPVTPPPVAVQPEVNPRQESEETRKARLDRLAAYKLKTPPVWFTDSHAKHDKKAS